MIGFPFDSALQGYDSDGYPIYDRAVNSSTLRKTYSEFFKNGVFPNPSTNMQVVNGVGLEVIIKKGSCIINGAIGVEIDDRKLVVQAADSYKDRIDTVVIRLDDNVDARKIDYYVIKGVAADIPTAPELNRTGSIHELGIANIFVPKVATAITQDRITDTRVDSTRCGYAVPFENIDTTALYTQIQADLANFKKINQAEYEAFAASSVVEYSKFFNDTKSAFTLWFDGIKGQLSTDAAGNLQVQLNTFDVRVKKVEEALLGVPAIINMINGEVV